MTTKRRLLAAHLRLSCSGRVPRLRAASLRRCVGGPAPRDHFFRLDAVRFPRPRDERAGSRRHSHGGALLLRRSDSAADRSSTAGPRTRSRWCPTATTCGPTRPPSFCRAKSIDYLRAAGVAREVVSHIFERSDSRLDPARPHPIASSTLLRDARRETGPSSSWRFGCRGPEARGSAAGRNLPRRAQRESRWRRGDGPRLLCGPDGATPGSVAGPLERGRRRPPIARALAIARDEPLNLRQSDASVPDRRAENAAGVPCPTSLIPPGG